MSRSLSSATRQSVDAVSNPYRARIDSARSGSGLVTTASRTSAWLCSAGMWVAADHAPALMTPARIILRSLLLMDDPSSLDGREGGEPSRPGEDVADGVGQFQFRVLERENGDVR